MSVAADEANVLHPDGGAGRKLLSPPEDVKLTWKRCSLNPMGRSTCRHAPSPPAAVFPLNSHSGGLMPSRLSSTLTDSSPGTERSQGHQVRGERSEKNT
ncbi:hypothetical protein EYF80_062760 [Liparis tanakae]|uniref:Uncharacterized protein n=1 Tax=Liparis tanakae TaxID=230148 RepID=A0A4Z2EDY9_9TELE|nr:hypothetical protein EYF80_062760 [Liparis tanakae]